MILSSSAWQNQFKKAITSLANALVRGAMIAALIPLLTISIVCKAESCVDLFGDRVKAQNSPRLDGIETLARTKSDNAAYFRHLEALGIDPYDFELWGSKSPRQKDSAFRAMDLTPAGLAHVLASGIEAKRSGFNKVYIDTLPEQALDFMFQYASDHPLLGVVFELSTTGLLLKNEFRTTYTSNDDIPASRIRRVYIFNPQAGPAFPFTLLLEFPGI